MSPEVLALRRWVQLQAPQVPWSWLVHEIGGLRNLDDYMTDGRPDPEKLAEAVSDISWELIGRNQIHRFHARRFFS